MLPQYLKLKNYTSYHDETINFSSFGNIFTIIGDNGAGKSSIIDAITTAIFCRARGIDSKGSGLDELINLNSDKFEIEFAFIMNNVSYKIIRRKSRGGSHELEFYIDGINQSEKLTETQAKINNIIKMDYDTFLDTVCVGQGQSGRFMKKKPNERKEVFVQVLGLDKYEVLEKYAKEQKKDISGKIENLESSYDNLQKEIDLKDQYSEEFETSKIKIDDYKKLIDNKEKEFEKVVTEKAKYEQIVKQRDHILNQRNLLKNKITTIKNNISINKNLKLELENKVFDKKDISFKMQELQTTINNDQTNFTNLSVEKTTIEANNNMLIKQAKECKIKYENLKNYNNATCDFCGHDITEDYKEDHLNHLMTEGKKYLNEINTNKISIDEFIKKIQEVHSGLIVNKQELQTLQSNWTKIAQAETQLISINNKINELELSLSENEKEYEDNLNIPVDEIENKTFNDRELKVEINNIRNDLKSWDLRSNNALKKLSEITDAEIVIQRFKKEIEENKILLSDYESLIIAYGKSGIQADIIANALPEIEEEINNLLGILCNNSINIEFRTQKEKKSKGKAKAETSIETLDIIINDEHGSRTYETYSGGEQFRVDFACHVGLAKFLAKRAGAVIDFFIVDEGLGSQDQNARNQFVSSVKQLTKIFKQVMIITHIDEIKESFDCQIAIEKDPINGSKLIIR